MLKNLNTFVYGLTVALTGALLELHTKRITLFVAAIAYVSLANQPEALYFWTVYVTCTLENAEDMKLTSDVNYLF